jgi:hypothetical protein
MALQLFKIASVLVESPQLTIDFNSIPQGYTDLLLKVSTRSDAGSTGANDGRLTFNGSSTGYSSRLLYGLGSTVGTASNSGSYLYWAFVTVSTGLTSNIFSNNDIYIPNYTSSSNKSVLIDGVIENNGAYGTQIITTGLWSNSSAITSISLRSDYGNYVANSTATLYGIL